MRLCRRPADLRSPPEEADVDDRVTATAESPPLDQDGRAEDRKADQGEGE
jgi:hypothetical protein